MKEEDQKFKVRYTDFNSSTGEAGRSPEFAKELVYIWSYQDIHEEKERQRHREIETDKRQRGEASTKPAWATKQNPALSSRLEWVIIPRSS